MCSNCQYAMFPFSVKWCESVNSSMVSVYVCSAIRLLVCCKNGRSTSWVLCGLFTQVGYKKRMWETTCKLENFLLLFLCPITCFQLFGCLVVWLFFSKSTLSGRKWNQEPSIKSQFICAQKWLNCHYRNKLLSSQELNWNS